MLSWAHNAGARKMPGTGSKLKIRAMAGSSSSVPVMVRVLSARNVSGGTVRYLVINEEEGKLKFVFWAGGEAG